MKIVLLNANPAVSRLATLALNKMGYEYVEIGDVSELEGVFDVLIIDSDIDVKETNLKEFANKILYLSSKHSPTFENADRILPKPFLPTEFITIVEYLAGKVRDAEDSGKVSVSGFEFMSDPVEDILKEEMMKTETDEFALDNELGEFLQDSAPQSKESAFDELNEIVKAIDDMDESSESLQEDDLNLDDLIDEVVKFDEPDEFEIDAKEEKFDDIEGILDAEDTDDTAEKFGAADELEDVKFETIDEPEDAEDKFELDFDGSIEDIKHQIDEIDGMDEEIKDELANFDAARDTKDAEDTDDTAEKFDAADELGDVKSETQDEAEPDTIGFTVDESEDEPEAVQNFTRMQDNDKFLIEETDEQEDIFADEEMKFEPEERDAQAEDDALNEFDIALEAIKDEPADDENLTQDIFDEESAEDIFADFEQDMQEISEPEAAQNEPEIAHKPHPSEYGDIEQISEKDMALALNESGFEGGEAANLSSQKAQTTSKINELKAQISDAVAKNLENSLQDGELREALKNLNIKINISFEEK